MSATTTSLNVLSNGYIKSYDSPKTDYNGNTKGVMPLMETSAGILNSDVEGIASFYADTVVLVTGGTGFLGKAILEKLLRSCPNIKMIYLLMRPKRGLTVEQRYKELVKNPVFDRIRSANPTQLAKFSVVGGDVSLPYVGLNEVDLERLIASVNIVIHSAATVRFTEALHDAITLNTLGTKRLLELCKQMKVLKSVVHVSTAYSNLDQPEIAEYVYPPPHDPDTMMHCVKSMPRETLDLISDRLLGNHPNTYTLTKAMAESVVQQYSGDLPICIVRPSIVTAAHQEPYPGWVDNVCGLTGIIMEVSRGTYRSGLCKRQEDILDIVPVDIVVNTCLAAAWRNTVHTSNSLTIYNCTSGGRNPVSWGAFMELMVAAARETPTKYAVMWPNFSFTSSRLVNTFWELVGHFLPAFIFDLLLRAQGRKPLMMKIARRFKLAAITGEYFAQSQWKFIDTNQHQLCQDVTSSKDGEQFPVDIAGLSWEEYSRLYMLGIRKYVLKDPIDTLPNARTKINRLYWAQQLVQCISGYYVFRLFTGRNGK